jgi:hypothetical protein
MATDTAPTHQPAGAIDALLHEERRYPPSPAFTAQANWNDPAMFERAAAAIGSATALLDHHLTCEQRQRRSRPGHHGLTAPRHGVDAQDHENHPRGWVADVHPVAYSWTP